MPGDRLAPGAPPPGLGKGWADTVGDARVIGMITALSATTREASRPA